LARASLRKRLGLDGPMADLMELNDLVQDTDLVEPTAAGAAGGACARGAEDLIDEMSGGGGGAARELSARERNQLKRKAKAAARHAAGGDKRARVESAEDAAASAAQAEADAAEDAAELGGGFWPFQSFLDDALLDLFAPRWEARHGAALALRGALAARAGCCGVTRGASASTAAAANAAWLCDAAIRLLCLLALDRFSDFGSDAAVGPVRETAAQALAACARALPAHHRSSAARVLLLLAARPSWEARHGGWMGLKYLFAACPALAAAHAQDALPASLAALADADGDVRAAAASAMLPAVTAGSVAPQDADALQGGLWRTLQDLDELSPAAAPIMQLLAALVDRAAGAAAADVATRAPLLWPFARHAASTVRCAAAQALARLLAASPALAGVYGADILCLCCQSVTLDPDEASAGAWAGALSAWLAAVPPAQLRAAALQHAHRLMQLACTADGCAPPARDLLLPVTSPPASAAAAAALGAPPRAAPSQQHLLGAYASAAMTGAARCRAAAALGSVAALTDGPARDAFAAALLAALGAASAASRIAGSLAASEWGQRQRGRAAEGAHLPDALCDALLRALDPPAAAAAYSELRPLRLRLRGEAAALAEAAQAVGGPLPEALLVEHLGGAPAAPSGGISADAAVTLAAHAPAGAEGAAARLLATAGYLRQQEGALATSAAAAAACGALSCGAPLPSKLNPLIQPLMASLRRERDEALQLASGRALALLLHCARARQPCPNERILRNLAVMACADPAAQPGDEEPDAAGGPRGGAASSSAAAAVSAALGGDAAAAAAAGAAAGSAADGALSEAAVARRGAERALCCVAERAGASLLQSAPELWSVATCALRAALAPSRGSWGDEADGAACGALADSLHTLTTIAASLAPGPPFQAALALLPALAAAARHASRRVRGGAARCLARLAACSPAEALPLVTAQLVMLLQEDAGCASARAGGACACAALVAALPAVQLAPVGVLLLVPLMAAMADAQQGVRTAAAAAFAQLVPLLPLAQGAPRPPGLPPALQARAEEDGEVLAALLDNSAVADCVLPVPLALTLRRYQQEGLNWLAFLRRFGLSGALCDDMGLGKTIQATAILAAEVHERRAQGLPHRPSLVVCPPTLVAHWAHEVGRYLLAPHALAVVQYGGPPASRASAAGGRAAPKLRAADLVVCSYETVRSDLELLGAIDWGYLILDEGHAIRNPKAKGTLAIKTLRAAHRLLLSGTPIQNDIGELWSLFDFLMPGFLGTERDFRQRYGTGGSRAACTVDALALNALHKAVMPFILRRMKADVLKELPPKLISDIVVDPSPLQRALQEAFQGSCARAEVEQALGGAAGAGVGEAGVAGQAFAALQYMRKVCAHPELALCGGSPERLAALARQLGGAAGAADPAAWLRRAEHAPKLGALTQILRDCGIGGDAEDEPGGAAAAPCEPAHRVLVFAQLKGLLDLVERDVFGPKGSLPGVTFLRLDGSVDATKRFDVARRFNADPSISVLLLTTHVGGLGLNLTSADTVVFLEHDWNPQRDLQAMDRAHRLGQTRCVTVYRLLTRDTLEERIMSLQRFKLDVSNAVVTADNVSMASMDTGALLELFTADKAAPLREGAASAEAGATGAAAVLAGLQELWEESQYAEEFSVDGFVSRLGVGDSAT